MAAVAGALMYFATLTEIPILQGLIGSGMGNGPALTLLLAGSALSLPNMLNIRFWKARENFGQFFMNQVKQANMVLMNQIDTAEPDQIPLALQEIRDTIPDSLVVPSLYCEIDPDTLWLGASKTVSGTEITNF